MVKKSIRIAIIGGSVWGNRGASAMLETTIHKLRNSVPDAQFAVFTPYPEKDASLINDPAIAFFDSRPRALIRYFLTAVWHWFIKQFGIKRKSGGGAWALTHSDLLLDIGGITFADGRLKYLPYNILTIWPSLIYNVPVVKLSQAVGPFQNPVLRFTAKPFLSRCDHIFARGEKTLEYLENLGLSKDTISLAADIAFGYQPAYCLTSENNTTVNQLCAVIDRRMMDGEKIVCISPSVLVSQKMKSKNQSYSELLTEIIKRSNYQDETYIFVPNASREGSKKSRNNDLHVIREIRDKAEIEMHSRIYNKILWIEYDLNTEGVEKIIQRANIVIASRFHAMVAALRSIKPTLIVGWGHKYKEVMTRFGQAEFVFDYQITAEDVLDRLSLLRNNESLISSQIESAYQAELKASDLQFDYIAGRYFEN